RTKKPGADRSFRRGAQGTIAGRRRETTSAASGADRRVADVVCPMTGDGRSRVSALAVAGPAVLTTFMVLVFSVAEILGHTPFAVGPVRNVAEAAGLGVPSEVLRLIGSGEDPNQVLDVRSEIISASVTRVSALEASVWSRRKELVELLDRRGAIV